MPKTPPQLFLAFPKQQFFLFLHSRDALFFCRLRRAPVSKISPSRTPFGHVSDGRHAKVPCPLFFHQAAQRPRIRPSLRENLKEAEHLRSILFLQDQKV